MRNTVLTKNDISQYEREAAYEYIDESNDFYYRSYTGPTGFSPRIEKLRKAANIGAGFALVDMRYGAVPVIEIAGERFTRQTRAKTLAERGLCSTSRYYYRGPRGAYVVGPYMPDTNRPLDEQYTLHINER